MPRRAAYAHQSARSFSSVGSPPPVQIVPATPAWAARSRTHLMTSGVAMVVPFARTKSPAWRRTVPARIRDRRNGHSGQSALQSSTGENSRQSGGTPARSPRRHAATTMRDAVPKSSSRGGSRDTSKGRGPRSLRRDASSWSQGIREVFIDDQRIDDVVAQAMQDGVSLVVGECDDDDPRRGPLFLERVPGEITEHLEFEAGAARYDLRVEIGRARVAIARGQERLSDVAELVAFQLLVADLGVPRFNSRVQYLLGWSKFPTLVRIVSTRSLQRL